LIANLFQPTRAIFPQHLQSSERPKAMTMKFDMTRRVLLAASMIGITLAAEPIAAEAGAPTEEQCRNAVTAMLEMLRQMPAEKPRDEEDRKRLLAEMERLVETNRRQGIGECRTWQEINVRAMKQ
jgi:hypothetical protein